MRWLLWREYRLNRLILAAGAVGVLLTFVIGALCRLLDDDRTVLVQAWRISIICSELTMATLAGNAIAGERSDRSAEFIACLPLSRRRLLTGKLLLLLMTIAVIWGVRVVIVQMWNVRPIYNSPELHSFPIQFLLIVGVSWFFSSLQSSAVIASAAGMVANWVVVGCSAGLAYSKYMGLLDPVPNVYEDFHEPMFLLHSRISIPLAIACFSIGTWNYLRRRDL